MSHEKEFEAWKRISHPMNTISLTSLTILGKATGMSQHFQSFPKLSFCATSSRHTCVGCRQFLFLRQVPNHHVRNGTVVAKCQYCWTLPQLGCHGCCHTSVFLPAQALPNAKSMLCILQQPFYPMTQWSRGLRTVIEAGFKPSLKLLLQCNNHFLQVAKLWTLL